MLDLWKNCDVIRQDAMRETDIVRSLAARVSNHDAVCMDDPTWVALESEGGHVT